MVKRVRDTAGTAGAIAAEAPADEWGEAERMAAELAGDAEVEVEVEEPGAGDGASTEGRGDYEPAASYAGLSEPADEPASDAGLSADKARITLRELGAERERLERRLAAVEGELWIAVRAAHAAAVPKLVIAKDAGVARQTVYNVLGKEAV